MWNDKGNALPETLLTLVITLTIFGTLLPALQMMKGILSDKKMAMYAAETAYQAAQRVEQGEQLQGSRTIESVIYQWYFMNNEVCVFYENLKGQQQKCIRP
ncbi:hypothetical protein [Viridibacillus arvi]|uniref:Competence protein ComG n=1 Tax=Viridibacillus arvi TaxID=263475 RepID=A0A0M0LM24_9BACL|nr:hypothetical protein [Viridibacillus arvi]KOO52130.1 hypothetical protein AMD00_06905 [Viridibacillus arvi]